MKKTPFLFREKVSWTQVLKTGVKPQPVSASICLKQQCFPQIVTRIQYRNCTEVLCSLCLAQGPCRWCPGIVIIYEWVGCQKEKESNLVHSPHSPVSVLSHHFSWQSPGQKCFSRTLSVHISQTKTLFYVKHHNLWSCVFSYWCVRP